MRVAVVSAFPPSRDNIGAPTALPYTLLQFIPAGTHVSLFYFEGPPEFQSISTFDIARLTLKSAEKIGGPGRLSRRFHSWWARKRGLPWGVGQFPVSRAVVRRIRSLRPDLVWLYPHWLIDWASHLRHMEVVVTGPDSATLHYERLIQSGSWLPQEELARQERALAAAEYLEQLWGQTEARIHVVGQRDRERMAQLTGRPAQIRFLPHPHFRYLPLERPMRQAQGKLTVVITGGAGTVYTGDHLSRLTQALIKAAKSLRSRYRFRMIGSGYAPIVDQFRSAGYEAWANEWVSDFPSAIAVAQIQIFPIAVGTGTKGKVLSALATGLLAIGSALAFENIEIDISNDALVYKEPEDVVAFLHRVWEELPAHEAMAQRASSKVRAAHAPERLCPIFWEWALNK